MGYDSHLDSAIQLVLDEHQNNDENEYEDFEDDEEEDY
jgi:hypothetical protein